MDWVRTSTLKTLSSRRVYGGPLVRISVVILSLDADACETLPSLAHWYVEASAYRLSIKIPSTCGFFGILLVA